MATLPRRLAVAVVTAAIVWFLSVKLTTFRDYQIAEVAIEVTGRGRAHRADRAQRSDLAG